MKTTFTPGFAYEVKNVSVHNRELGDRDSDYLIRGTLTFPENVCPIHIREDGKRMHFLMDIVGKHGSTVRSVFDLADLVCQALNIASEHDPKFAERLERYSDKVFEKKIRK